MVIKRRLATVLYQDPFCGNKNESFLFDLLSLNCDVTQLFAAKWKTIPCQSNQLEYKAGLWRLGGGTGSASQVDILSNSPWAKIPPSGSSVARISTFPTYISLQ